MNRIDNYSAKCDVLGQFWFWWRHLLDEFESIDLALKCENVRCSHYTAAKKFSNFPASSVGGFYVS